MLDAMVTWRVLVLASVSGFSIACGATEGDRGGASGGGTGSTDGVTAGGGAAPRDLYEAAADLVGIYRIERRSGDARGCGDEAQDASDITHFWLTRFQGPDFVETCGCSSVEGCRGLRAGEFVPCLEQRILVDYVSPERFETHSPINGILQGDVCKQAGYTVQTLQRMPGRTLLVDASFYLADLPATDGKCVRDESRVGSPAFACSQRTVLSAVWEAPLEP